MGKRELSWRNPPVGLARHEFGDDFSELQYSCEFCYSSASFFNFSRLQTCLMGCERGDRVDMERRAASHTEEEEMNQRRKLLNAAKRGDQKAVGKLFELYQVRVMNPDQLTKINKVYAAMPIPVKSGSSRSNRQSSKGSKQPPTKPGAPVKPVQAEKPSKPKAGTQAKLVTSAKPAPSAPKKKAAKAAAKKPAVRKSK